MSEKKIKKAKTWLKELHAQFTVLQRRSPGKAVDITIVPSGILADWNEPKKEKSATDKKEFHKTLIPPDQDTGVIQIVERISDRINFYQGDSVFFGKENGFIFEFNEDLVHCGIALLFEQVEDKSFIEVEINDLSFEYNPDIGDEE